MVNSRNYKVLLPHTLIVCRPTLPNSLHDCYLRFIYFLPHPAWIPGANEFNWKVRIIFIYTIRFWHNITSNWTRARSMTMWNNSDSSEACKKEAGVRVKWPFLLLLLFYLSCICLKWLEVNGDVSVTECVTTQAPASITPLCLHRVSCWMGSNWLYSQ
jgi:hypothetical protein